MCCTSEELFLEHAMEQGVNLLVNFSLPPPFFFFSLRQYVGVLDKFCAKTISINKFSSERVLTFFYQRYTNFHISGLIVDQMTYHFHI